jgi:hypothetical protein
MKIAILSKALVVGVYRSNLMQLAASPNSDLGNQNLIIVIILAVVAIAIALPACLLLDGKAKRVNLSGFALMAVITMFLDLASYVVPLDYYAILYIDALIEFSWIVCFLIMTFSMWMEWIWPPSQWRIGDYRKRSILRGIFLSICSIGIAILVLPREAAFVSDIATGPSFDKGTIEDLSVGRGGRKDFVVRGVSYRTTDIDWYYTLSTEQTISFAYSPSSHYGFSTTRMTLSPWGFALPSLVLGFTLLAFSFCFRLFTPVDNTPARHEPDEKREQVEQLINRIKQPQGVIPLVFAVIVSLLLLGLALLAVFMIK